jgi:hypothetical protein
MAQLRNQPGVAGKGVVTVMVLNVTSTKNIRLEIDLPQELAKELADSISEAFERISTWHTKPRVLTAIRAEVERELGA